MKLDHPALLKTIFSLKGDFAPGLLPERKVFSGIEIAPFKNDAKAAVSISSDFEMCWAWKAPEREARAQQERENIPHILRLLEQYSMPITWATVGHLFLESCTRSSSGLAHEDMPRPRVNERWEGDWYKYDPCSNVQKDPLWYAPDLVQQVIDCRTPQEISTHSFSHINFSARCSTTELVRREMGACIEAMRPFGLRPQSLVFPHNVDEYSYLPLLAEVGVTAVRHRDEKVKLCYPERTASGVYKIYESMNLRTAKRYEYFRKAEIFIQKATERQAACSLWFHPSDSFDLFDHEFRLILQHIDAERRDGRVWVATMRDLAAYCEAREQLQIKIERTEDMLVLSLQNALNAMYGDPEITLLVPVSRRPRTAAVHLDTGETRHLNVESIPTKNARDSFHLIVNIPARAKALEFAL